MKKLLLSLGTVAAVVAPVAAVVACGSTPPKTGAVEDSELNSNEAVKALGAKDGSYTSSIKSDSKYISGSFSLTFTATKAGKLDGVDIKANSKVTITEGANSSVMMTINGTKVNKTGDVDKVDSLIGSI